MIRRRLTYASFLGSLLGSLLVACSGGVDTTAATATDATGTATDASTTDASTTDASTTDASTEATTGTDTAGESTGESSSTGFDDPVQCTSNVYWTKGDLESPLMHPGRACIACHKAETFHKPPIFLAAGTVYPSGHEPDECNGVGVASGAIVVLTDAMGVSYELPVNDAGNFFLETAANGFPLPFTAKVVVGDQERPMLAPQMDGDCNGCHTQDGTMNAPGRIVTP